MPAFPEQSSASIEVRAAPEVVWELVADITQMGKWSPECFRAEWEDGSTGPVVGANFHGFNRVGTFEWDLPCVVTECEAGKSFAFEAPRGGSPNTQWRYEFTPCAAGTVLTESFEAPLINVEGSPANYEGRFETLTDAIKTTIANIKGAAEAAAG